MEAVWNGHTALRRTAMEAVWNGTAELVDGLGLLTGGLIDWMAPSLYLKIVA
jgi:hypothetical protein